MSNTGEYQGSLPPETREANTMRARIELGAGDEGSQEEFDAFANSEDGILDRPMKIEKTYEEEKAELREVLRRGKAGEESVFSKYRGQLASSLKAAGISVLFAGSVKLASTLGGLEAPKMDPEKTDPSTKKLEVNTGSVSSDTVEAGGKVWGVPAVPSEGGPSEVDENAPGGIYGGKGIPIDLTEKHSDASYDGAVKSRQELGNSGPSEVDENAPGGIYGKDGLPPQDIR